MVRTQSSGSFSQSGPMGGCRPAQLTSTSILPNRSRAPADESAANDAGAKSHCRLKNVLSSIRLRVAKS